MSTTIEIISHYQRSIEKSKSDEKRLLHCIEKLFKLHVTVDHLQETGIGKTVNSLRKYDGEVGIASKTLVTKWKAMVAAAEDFSEETDDKHNENEDNRFDVRGYDELHKINALDDFSNKHQNSSGKLNKTSMDQIADDGHCRNERNCNSDDGEEEEEKLVIDINKNCKSSMDINNFKVESASNNSFSEREDNKSIPKESSHKTPHRSSKNDHKKEKRKDSSKKDNLNEKTRTHKSSHKRSRDKSSENKSSRDEKHAKKSYQADHHKKEISSDDQKKSNKSSSDRHKKRKLPENDSSETNVIKILKDNGVDSSMGTSFGDALAMIKYKPKSSKEGNITGNGPSSSSSVSKTSTNSCRTNIAVKSESLELLSPTRKLEPLDHNVVLSSLPTISTNYKPMPINPNIMECVYSNQIDLKPPKKFLNDFEALTHGISSKTMRTKVYSGAKTGAVMQVTSLFNLCIRVLQKNIDSLEYTGGVPFDILKPVLMMATPQQLEIFEEYNPYVMEDTDVLWEQHAKRHCRGQKRQELESWREMYLRYKEEQEYKLQNLAINIKKSQKEIALPVKKTQLAYVDSMVKAPRNVAKKQEQYGTKHKLIATPAARVASLSSITPNAAKIGDNRLRIAPSSRDPAQSSGSFKQKKAPLMAKTIQLMKGRFKR